MEFFEEGHKYIHKENKYESVSQRIARYKPEFPKEFIAGKIAKRDDIEYEDVLAEWKMIGDVSSNYGNAIDLTVDYFIKYGKKPKQLFLKKVADEFEEMTKGFKMKSQVILFSELNNLAGTTDVIVSHGKKEISILDVKSNGEINKKANGYFNSPFSKLACDKINTYRLQLSFYKQLAEDHGFKVREIALLHWTDKWTKIVLEKVDLKETYK